MEKLSNDIREVAEQKNILSTEEHLRETAQKWANFSLKEYDGDLLTKALMISKSIADFLNEMEIEPK